MTRKKKSDEAAAEAQEAREAAAEESAEASRAEESAQAEATQDDVIDPRGQPNMPSEPMGNAGDAATGSSAPEILDKGDPEAESPKPDESLPTFMSPLEKGKRERYRVHGVGFAPAFVWAVDPSEAVRCYRDGYSITDHVRQITAVPAPEEADEEATDEETSESE
jgi:hypothetical protein